MPRILTLLLVGILIAVAALFFVFRPPEKSDLPPSANTGEPISMPMPKPPPDPVKPPEVPEPETVADEKIIEAMDDGEGETTAEKKEETAPAVDEIEKEAPVAPLIESSITRELKDVQVQTDDGRANIIIQADGPIQAVGPDKGFKYFFLIDPERLVIDLAGDWVKPPPNGKVVENDLVLKVRFWKYPQKLRIVCDLKEKKALSPSFMEIPDGLMVTLIKNDGGMSEKQSARTE